MPRLGKSPNTSSETIKIYCHKNKQAVVFLREREMSQRPKQMRTPQPEAIPE